MEEAYHSCPKRGGRYINPFAMEIKRTLKDVLFWKMGHFDDLRDLTPLPPDFVYPLPQENLESPHKATWINHSTFLISFDQTTILTDPIWSKRCSPLMFMGPKRRFKAPLTMEQLPKIDAVLISHNHYDHLDVHTVLKLTRQFPSIKWIVPHGLKSWFLKKGILRVEEFGWWEESRSLPGFKITAVPGQHFSGRSCFDLNKTLWCGWVVENEQKRLYFAGDTGYNPYHFRKIGSKWKHMDLSLIPIGTYTPREFMAPVHINPEEAVAIHQEVFSKKSLGIHWRTFNLSDEEWNRPPYDLFIAMQNRNLDPHHFLAVEPGYPVSW